MIYNNLPSLLLQDLCGCHGNTHHPAQRIRVHGKVTSQHYAPGTRPHLETPPRERIYLNTQTRFRRDIAKQQLKLVLDGGRQLSFPASLLLHRPNESTDKWPAVKMGFFRPHIGHYPDRMSGYTAYIEPNPGKKQLRISANDKYVYSNNVYRYCDSMASG